LSKLKTDHNENNNETPIENLSINNANIADNNEHKNSNHNDTSRMANLLTTNPIVVVLPQLRRPSTNNEISKQVLEYVKTHGLQMNPLQSITILPTVNVNPVITTPIDDNNDDDDYDDNDNRNHNKNFENDVKYEHSKSRSQSKSSVDEEYNNHKNFDNTDNKDNKNVLNSSVNDKQMLPKQPSIGLPKPHSEDLNENEDEIP